LLFRSELRARPEFDARAGWNNGFRSCAAWLSWRVGLDLGAARERVRVARALGTLPLLARALACGELSYAKVRALTRVTRTLKVYQDEDGMVTVRGRLAPEVGALLVQALAAAREALYQRRRLQEEAAGPTDVSAETPTMAQWGAPHGASPAMPAGW
jgi:Domain of unknown function (DUF222)